MPEIQQLRLNLESYLILATATLLPVAWLWIAQVRPLSLLPPQRKRLVPWTGFEIVLALFFLWFFWPSVIDAVLSKSKFLVWLYESEMSALPGTDMGKLAHVRSMFWMSVLSWPLQIMTVFLLLRVLSNTRPYQLGFSTHDLSRNIILAWIGWALLTPVVLCCHIAAEWLFQSAWGYSPEEHPLLRIFATSSLGVERLVIIVSATVLAPVLEELLFRGLLQRWLARRQWGGNFAMFAAVAFTFLLGGDRLIEAWGRANHAGFVREIMPFLFVIAMVPCCYVLERSVANKLARPQDFRAIYGTALLFAMFHVSVWPTPVPLFLLALGLGYLAYRTQSVVGPILMHVLFNTVACVALFLA